jgi:Zn finger protein HypA/HybF involved in hydrogenase expression
MDMGNREESGLRRSLEETVSEQAEKIAMLKVEMGEREATKVKSLKDLAEAEKTLRSGQKNLEKAKVRLEESQNQVSILCETLKLLEDDKLHKKRTCFLQQEFKKLDK